MGLKEAEGGTSKDLGVEVEVYSVFQHGEVHPMCPSPGLGMCSVLCDSRAQKDYENQQVPLSFCRLHTSVGCLFSPSPSHGLLPLVSTVLQCLLYTLWDILVVCSFTFYLPLLQEVAALPASSQLPLNPRINDTDTQLSIFNLPSWHNSWALISPAWKSVPLPISYLCLSQLL